MSVPPPAELNALVKDYAREVGFDLARVAAAAAFTKDRDTALARIKAGLMDGLPWYTPQRVMRGSDPAQLLPGAKSIICLALNYYPANPANPPDIPDPESAAGVNPAADRPTGQIARYARGRDYHRVMKTRMRDYVAALSTHLDLPIAARWYVDDGPMLDRAAAARAGIGWFGKNTNILTPQLGSWVFLGQVITDLNITPDEPLPKTCGSCARCLPACPTGAIIAPYVIDNARCISHLTIENRGPIPRPLRPLIGDWIFGCDLCQEVCPVNRKAQPAQEPTFGRHELATVDLIALLEMSDADFRERFQGTPILRAKRVGLQRNACVALGNGKNPAAIPALTRALQQSEPLVRAHAAWALGQIGGTTATAALQTAATQEKDPEVLAEIQSALLPNPTPTLTPNSHLPFPSMLPMSFRA